MLLTVELRYIWENKNMNYKYKKKLKKLITLFAFIPLFFFSFGCAGMYGTVLPSNPIAFSLFPVTDSKNTTDKYYSIEYNGRIYVPFGTAKSTLKKSDIDQCLGYLDYGTGPNNIHICTLIADPNNDFLVRVYGYDPTEKPAFYRASDTYSQQINIPTYIMDLGFDYWK